MVRPWKPPEKAMTAGALGVVARDLDRIFDRLGAGIQEQRLLREVARAPAR